MIAIITIYLNCSSDSITDPARDQIVIQAYVYAGQPLTNVRITSTLPLGTEDLSAPPVNDAVVEIIKDGVRYDLVSSPGDSGYYHYPGNDLYFQTGDVLRLETEYGGTFVYGETVVPPPPAGVSLSSGTLIYPEFSGFGGGFNQDIFQYSRIYISWRNIDNSLYYVTVENIEANPVPIESNRPSFGGRLSFISMPTAADSMMITFNNITHLGTHRATLYSINQEYADLYNTQSQDSRDLNEPLSNIVNGLGVFTAFNSAGVTFEVRY